MQSLCRAVDIREEAQELGAVGAGFFGCHAMKNERGEEMERIEFDGRAEGIILRFAEGAIGEEGDGGSVLLWGREASPEVLEEVVEYIGGRKLPVDAVVISGLSDYPVGGAMLARWLVGLAVKAGKTRVLVESEDLSCEERRRLIDLIRREERRVQERDFLSWRLKRWWEGWK